VLFSSKIHAVLAVEVTKVCHEDIICISVTMLSSPVHSKSKQPFSAFVPHSLDGSFDCMVSGRVSLLRVATCGYFGHQNHCNLWFYRSGEPIARFLPLAEGPVSSNTFARSAAFLTLPQSAGQIFSRVSIARNAVAAKILFVFRLSVCIHIHVSVHHCNLTYPAGGRRS